MKNKQKTKSMRARTKYLFVCGCARSGTTAVRILLNQHHRIVIGVERYVEKLNAGLGLQQQDFDREIFFAEVPPKYEKQYKNMALRYDRARYVGDKIPRLYERFASFHAEFDDAKIIFLVRNIFDVASSYKKRAENAGDLWLTQRAVFTAIRDWNKSLSCVLEWMGRLDLHVIEYESFYYHHIGFEGLLDFLDLKYTRELEERWEIMRNKSLRLELAKKNALLTGEIREICTRANWEAYKQVLRSAKIISGNNRFRRDRLLGFDYDQYTLKGTLRKLRCPDARLADNEPNLIFAGSELTFGRWVKRPFCMIVADHLGLKFANLGHAYSEPQWYLDNPKLLQCINDSDVFIYQLQPVWCQENDYLKPLDAYESTVLAKDWLNVDRGMHITEFYTRLYEKAGLEVVQHSIAQSGETWVNDMRRFLSKVKVPAILLWTRYSDSTLDKKLDHLNSSCCPQFVDEQLVNQLDGLYKKVIIIDLVDIPDLKRRYDTVSEKELQNVQAAHALIAETLIPVVEAYVE